jgi:transcriptional regulator with XRE-family HTH domain
MVSMEWLKKRRKQLGLSQEEFANRLQLAGYGVSRASIGQWETGYARPQLDNPDFVKALSIATELDINTVLQYSGYNVITQHSSTAEQIAALVDKLSEDKQRLALALIEQLAKV